MKPTGSDARFRGLAPVSKRVAWVSGTAGTVLRTVDGDATWQHVSPTGLGTEELQFRDIEAFDARRAVILSIGEGGDSRILRTINGGASWTETFRNEEPTAFYDCMAFTTPQRGVAMSDPVDGKFRLIRTTDGGRTWSRINPKGRPDAKEGEAAFAASGSCLRAGVGARTYLVSGGTNPARVFPSPDAGRTWTVADSPLAGSPSAGIFSIAYRGPRLGIIVGGDYLAPTAATENAAFTSGGGKTWRKSKVNPSGYRSVGLRLGAAHPRHRPCGRAVWLRRHDRRWAHVEELRHGQLRRGRVHPRRRLLGLGRAGPGGGAQTLIR